MKRERKVFSDEYHRQREREKRRKLDQVNSRLRRPREGKLERKNTQDTGFKYFGGTLVCRRGKWNWPKSGERNEKAEQRGNYSLDGKKRTKLQARPRG